MIFILWKCTLCAIYSISYSHYVICATHTMQAGCNDMLCCVYYSHYVLYYQHYVQCFPHYRIITACFMLFTYGIITVCAMLFTLWDNHIFVIHILWKCTLCAIYTKSYSHYVIFTLIYSHYARRKRRRLVVRQLWCVVLCVLFTQ